MSSWQNRPPDLPKAAVEALRKGNLIEAIKVVRRDRNIGMKEAKAHVEEYIASHPALKKKMDKVLAEAQQKFIRWMIGLLVVIAAGVTYLVIQKLGM